MRFAVGFFSSAPICANYQIGAIGANGGGAPIAYPTEPEEIWARAYTQWIATKTDGNIMGLLKASHAAEIGYWDNDDFNPIMDVIDDVFRQEGWL